MTADINPKFLDLARTLFRDRRPVICDIGSRDAMEGIALAQQLNARELHVFEANPNAAKICRQNLAARGEIVHFNEVAVTDTVGQLKFYPVNVEQSDNKDIGFSSLLKVNPDYTKRRGKIVQDEVLVDATTLDEYFKEKTEPDLLWVDVEGAELHVFRGGKHTLGSVKLIHVEVSFRPMQVGKPLFWEIAEYLKAQGFAFHGFMEISALRAFVYRYRLLPNLPWRLNAVFVRR